jgi:hypothetical protein
MTYPKGAVVVKYRGKYYEARPCGCAACTDRIGRWFEIEEMKFVFMDFFTPVTLLAREIVKKAREENDFS